MIDNENLIKTLQQTRSEIRHLRSVNEIMSAKLEVFETFQRSIMGMPRPVEMSPDICVEIDIRLRQLQEEIDRRPRPEKYEPA
jgi:hypothetical protein